MNQVSKAKRLRNFILNFEPDFEPISRGLAVYSAAIALADESALKESAQKALELGANAQEIYEIMLQSYLFLGFPRMLTAAESFRQVFPKYIIDDKVTETADIDKWKKRGTGLCQRVYGENFKKLKDKILWFSPEIYELMTMEGYGKILSRPALDIKFREPAIVSCLIIENRPRQLHSHLRGALNVGVAPKLLEAVIGDLKDVDPEGHHCAGSLFKLAKSND